MCDCSRGKPLVRQSAQVLAATTFLVRFAPFLAALMDDDDNSVFFLVC